MRILLQIIENIVIVELYNPVYDFDKKILKYDVTPDKTTSIELPSEFEDTNGNRPYKKWIYRPMDRHITISSNTDSFAKIRV
ncbi:MAG TPA: hypothetical protein VK250_03360 [Nitrososphaeraceae archaeon]|nr:hypothetical protein [Nitrososphaeraceae archaeon]